MSTTSSTAPSAHLEVERTFTVQASTQLPDLVDGTVAEVRHVDDATLVAGYHDSPDLQLLRAGITVRRREGGADEGWHIKVATGGGRLELQRPMTKTDVPPVGVRRLLRGVLRGAELVPVAEVRTRRGRLHLLGDDGRVLAELARDQVATRRLLGPQPPTEQHWQELEVELVDGDLRLLSRLSEVLAGAGIVESQSQSKLRRALGDLADPARPPAEGPATSAVTAGEALQAHLAAHWVQLQRRDVGVRAGSPDAVHTMRTAARRLRSSVAAYRRLFDPDQARRLEALLRGLGRELSVARDLQVAEQLLCDTLEQDAAPFPPGPTVRAVHRAVAGRRREAARAVAELLDSDDYLRMLDEVATFVAVPPLRGRAARPAGRVLRREVGRTHRRVLRRWAAAERAAPDRQDTALHAVRKASKRLRHACEVAESVLGEPAGRLRRRAKALTDVLGEHHDTVVLGPTVVELLPEAAVGRSADERAFALGRAHARLDVRRHRHGASPTLATRRLRAGRATSWLR